MKKKLCLILAGVIAASIALSGCGSRASETGGSVSGSAAGSLSAEAEKEVETKNYSTRQLMKMLDYNPKDCVKLPKNYDTMKVTLDYVYAADEADVRAYEEELISQNPTYVVKGDKKVVEKGDTVNIDYVGKTGGKPFEGGTAQDQMLEIGSGSFIEGFEDGLVGKKVGDTVTLDLTFPKEYQDDKLAGKKAEFTVTINYIGKEQKVTIDTINDEYVAQNFASTYGYTTVQEFEEGCSSQANEQASSSQSTDIQNAIFDKIEKEGEVTVPDSLVESHIKETKDGIEKAAKEQGMDVAGYLDQMYGGMTEEEFDKEIKTELQESLKQEVINMAIVQDLKIKVDKKELKSFIEEYMGYYGMSDPDQFYEMIGGEDQVVLSYAQNQAWEQLMSSVRVTYKLPKSDAESQTTEEASGE